MSYSLVVVMLYGLDSLERTDYREYLNWVEQQIAQSQSRQVILCGGFTDPDRPEESEASTVKAYLSPKLQNIEWLLVETSITTLQNIVAASTLIEKRQLDTTSILVVGDRARQAKIAWLAMAKLAKLDTTTIYNYLQEYVNRRQPDEPLVYNTITIAGYPYTTSESDILRQTYSSLLEVLPLFEPGLEEVADRQQRANFGLSK